MCSDGTDGQRLWIDGYLQLPSDISIDKGKTGLDFYPQINGNGEGKGRSLRVNITSPGDIDDLWASATGKRTSGFRQKRGQMDNDALRIRARNGTATARDKIRLTFDIEAIHAFRSKDVSTCLYNFVKAEKL